MSACKRILVIDDDPDFIRYVRIVLEAGGYAVEAVETVAEGLEALRRRPPDLVISDVMLARALNGYSIGRFLQDEAHLAHIPLLMVSAIVSADESDLELAQDARAAAFMSKPIAPGELLAQATLLMNQAQRMIGGD